VFSIEVSASMLQLQPETGKSAVWTALNAAYESIADRVMYTPLDAAGVFLFGTEQSSGDFKHCYTIIELEMANSKSLRKLKRILDDESEFRNVCKPASEETILSDVFFCANQEFTNNAPRHLSRRLFLFTDNDNPNQDATLRKAARTRALDLTQLGVRITPYFLLTGEDEQAFDTSLFYDQLVLSPRIQISSTQSVEMDEIFHPQKLSAFNLLHDVKMRQNLRRAAFTNHIELTPELRFGIRGYNLFIAKEKARSHWIHLGGGDEPPRIVECKSELSIMPSARVLEPDQVLRCYQFGDYPVPFLPEQIREMRNFGEPVIRVLGFKPLSALERRFNVDHSVFIYPTDQDLKGSIRAFASLHSTLLAQKKMAIAWTIMRRNSSPRIQAPPPQAWGTNSSNHERCRAALGRAVRGDRGP
jgi:ATP-dependent DNA helicase 2 subunit 1